jgi:glycerophosphoryl diester phosphodiesterase
MPFAPLHLPRIVGHRGAASYAPENTLASLREARRRGASWVEFDAKLTADGVVILMHDASLKRTTGLDRDVAATPWSEIQRLDAGAWMAARFAGEPVATLEAAIACLREEGLGANVEIKPCTGRESATARAVIDVIGRLWPAELPTPLLSSFSDVALAAARQASPELPRAVLIDDLAQGWRARAEAAEAVGVNTNGGRLNTVLAAEIRAAGYLLSAYTINEPALAKALIGMGVDCIITDAPDVIAAAVPA